MLPVLHKSVVLSSSGALPMVYYYNGNVFHESHCGCACGVASVSHIALLVTPHVGGFGHSLCHRTCVAHRTCARTSVFGTTLSRPKFATRVMCVNLGLDNVVWTMTIVRAQVRCAMYNFPVVLLCYCAMRN